MAGYRDVDVLIQVKVRQRILLHFVQSGERSGVFRGSNEDTGDIVVTRDSITQAKVVPFEERHPSRRLCERETKGSLVLCQLVVS